MFDCVHPPSPHALKSIFDRCAEHIETRYGVDVMIADVLDPNTGDFNGATIKVDHDQDLESALFVLIHLFGHTVQWNTSEEFRVLGQETASKILREDLPGVYAYEREATGLSISLLHELGIHDLDQWVSDWWAADWSYLIHFFKTGEKRDIREILQPGAERIIPKAIPKFTPQAYVSRWSF